MRCVRHGHKILGSKGCKQCIEEADKAKKAKAKTLPPPPINGRTYTVPPLLRGTIAVPRGVGEKPYTDHRLKTPKRTEINYAELLFAISGVTGMRGQTVGSDFFFKREVTITMCHYRFSGELTFVNCESKYIYETIKNLLCQS